MSSSIGLVCSCSCSSCCPFQGATGVDGRGDPCALLWKKTKGFKKNIYLHTLPNQISNITQPIPSTITRLKANGLTASAKHQRQHFQHLQLASPLCLSGFRLNDMTISDGLLMSAWQLDSLQCQCHNLQPSPLHHPHELQQLVCGRCPDLRQSRYFYWAWTLQKPH